MTCHVWWHSSQASLRKQVRFNDMPSIVDYRESSFAETGCYDELSSTVIYHAGACSVNIVSQSDLCVENDLRKILNILLCIILSGIASKFSRDKFTISPLICTAHYVMTSNNFRQFIASCQLPIVSIDGLASRYQIAIHTSILKTYLS